MEPKAVGVRPNRMLADTSAIHAFGVAQSRQTVELAAIEARLASAATACSPDALGPVGNRFVAALTEAMSRERVRVAELGERMAAAGNSANSTAAGYLEAETRAGRGLTPLGS
jgi:hypothetical protein